MNRQVLPSMVLSVLIVCFFAVVLFPLERDREQAVKAGPAPKAAEPPDASQRPKPAPSPSAVATAEPAPQPAAPAETRAPSPAPTPSPEPEPAGSVAVQVPGEAAGPAEVARPREGPRHPILASAPSTATAPVASAEAAEPPAPPSAVRPPVPAPPPAAPESAVKEPARVGKHDGPPPAVVAKENENTPEPARTDQAPPRAEPVSIPRSDPDVTIVDRGETLDDVAIRVYGSRSGVETLLRANREVLTRRKGPLKTGLQLWTPGR